ncbi:hypothetical protein [Enterobacter roggenkampii]|uniref:SMI1/KNR4 family protein n=1 Tax=Enterobacter roggenkampii TaxID=1812935 RepID=A0ABD4R1P1_9ENTR|nr:hypothetical protein [Enterobacter roggenkampii]CAF3121669.1 hypothetical protein AI2992V5_1054 [Enterobacter cloacae]EPY94815.1 hypothetical protein L799_19975 [Enterobacter roggenkampii EC_38VIM1]KTK02203.1 hypothetical protein ASU70_05655 [Enterobacter roggenkampii]MBU3754911.1 hypothetical protein [Enterobacter roggenkampii]MBU3760764.1 hypothetical protein [Enterobacter roggenkampii]
MDASETIVNEIEKGLKQLIVICNKYSLSGSFSTVNDLDNAFPSNLPRSTEVEFLYKNYNPEKLKIEIGFTPIKLHSVSELLKANSGYEYLPDNYLVIGDDLGGGKPIIAVIDDGSASVSAGYDVIEPFQIASSLSGFIYSLAELIDLGYGKYDIFDIADDNDEVKDDFIDELRKRVVPILGNEGFNAFYDYFYG